MDETGGRQGPENGAGRGRGGGSDEEAGVAMCAVNR